MNFILRIAWAHIEAAVLKNWKTTACGVIVAVLGTSSKLMPYFQGHGIDQVDWAGVGQVIMTAVGLVLAKDFSLTSIIFSAPRAEEVKPTSRSESCS